MQTAVRIRQTDALIEPIPVAITEDIIREYLTALSFKGRTRSTVCVYSTKLKTLWNFLPSDKLIYPGTLSAWRDALLEHGYSAATINTYITVANGLLDHLGRRDLQLPDRLEETKDVQPELTRREYLRLLQAAKALNRERTYLIIKTFALTGIQTVDLARISVETVKIGWLQVTVEGERQNVPIPSCLRKELTDYIGQQGILSGPVFVTRNGNSLRRTQVTAEIQALSRDARVDRDKCNPRCLRKLYRMTQADIERTVRLLAIQSYEQMLETEQLTVGWESQ